jgi:uncharacterized lipoprotein YmbA
MRARQFGTLALVFLALGLSSCVSLKRTPEARFFVLQALAEAPEGAASPLEGGVVGLLRIVVPDYLERPQVVSWIAPGELKIDEFLRWAEPIDAGVSRTLAEDLQTLLPKTRIIRAPWPSSVKLRCRVRVELERFGPQTNGEVQLGGRFALLPVSSEQPLVAHPVSLRRGPLPTAAGGLPDVGVEVEALSQLVADLARQIVAALQELPPPPEEG